MLFLTFSVLIANSKKVLYTVAIPARGLLNRGGERRRQKVWQRTPLPLPPHCSFGEKTKIMRRIYMSRCYAGRRYAGFGPSCVRTRIPLTRRLGRWVSLYKIHASVCDNNFPSLVPSLFSGRCRAASSSSFLLAAINLRLLSVTTSTHTSAFSAIVFQSVMPNARMSLCTQSVHSFFFPPRLYTCLRTMSSTNRTTAV